jgi:hypothetical protein
LRYVNGNYALSPNLTLWEGLWSERFYAKCRLAHAVCVLACRVEFWQKAAARRRQGERDEEFDGLPALL